MSESLHDLVAAELAEPVDQRAINLATAVAARYPGAARAVLFYGSCLREKQLDGLMLDFYLIVSDYRAAYGESWLATANRLVPPNVFPFEADGLTCKYAVLSEADFARLCSRSAPDPSVWARFAQPSRLVWAADEMARERAIASIARAAPALIALTEPTMDPNAHRDPLDVWRAGFVLTYGAELRAERAARPGAIVDADPERYRRFGGAARAIVGLSVVPNTEGTRAGSRTAWRRMQRRGKRTVVLRLLKASATFAGGIDYLAWKINRHAGTQITIRPWQRRWPILGAITLLPRLLAKGAVR
ncbi:hypothetical protein HZF05_05030 [Sphingomonas sp. CGMCC 1.13654]|uniref:Phosphatidate cytidylyltransferase n=1 Tax=Sphingomonas chungangi TaxID=2683589 RepID=A0A838L5I8_9SPHN|nr:hypothetical protein [Sphingomonas chungangi]MBA2933456.1 hypothetical protein [Sphingomonas chungangi]MVW54789.1 hypothetical protein [Sphingomonas chungangi]